MCHWKSEGWHHWSILSCRFTFGIQSKVRSWLLVLSYISAISTLEKVNENIKRDFFFKFKDWTFIFVMLWKHVSCSRKVIEMNIYNLFLKFDIKMLPTSLKTDNISSGGVIGTFLGTHSHRECFYSGKVWKLSEENMDCLKWQLFKVSSYSVLIW